VRSFTRNARHPSKPTVSTFLAYPHISPLPFLLHPLTNHPSTYEISMIYLHASYTPSDFPTPSYYNTRPSSAHEFHKIHDALGLLSHSPHSSNFQVYWYNPTYLMAKFALCITGGLLISFTFCDTCDSLQATQNTLYVVLYVNSLHRLSFWHQRSVSPSLPTVSTRR
jgi:hypothetical protein